MSDVCNIEFLDLSDVDEHEQIRVRASLQHNNPSVQLPWIKSGSNKTTNFGGIKQAKREVKQIEIAKIIPNNEYIHPTISSAPYLSQEFRQSPVVMAPLIAGPCPLFASTLSPVSSSYPQQIYAIPQNTISNVIHSYPNTTYPYTIATPPTTYPYPVTAPQIHMQGNIVTNSLMQQQSYGNGIIHPMVNKMHPNFEMVPHPTIIEKQMQAPPPPLPPVTGDKLNDSHGDGLAQPAPVMLPVVENGVKSKPDKETTSSPSSTGKSWASLFNSSKTNNGVNSQAAADVTEKVVDKAVNKESNNNETFCPIKHPRRSQFVDPDCYRMGEYLTGYAVDGRAVSLQPRGLINQSNYCYINSILQALIACPPLYNLLCGLSQNISSNEKRKPTPVIDGMCRFVKEFKQLPANMRVNNRRSEGKNQKKDQGVMINTDIPFEPAWIYKMLNGIRTDLIEGRQEDAEEFLGCLLNGLNDEMLELIKLIKKDCDETAQVANNPDGESDADKEWQVMGPKNKGSVTRRTDFGRTPVSDIFGGLLRSRIHRAGDHVTENIQPFFTLQLNIEKVKTVREALEALVTKNQLEGLTSSKTNEEVEAWQQVMLDELPIILVLHLKCFDFKLDGCTKIIKALEFPIDLKIDTKLLSSKTHQNKEKQYKLFAVVYHDGKEATKGHYVTDAFHVGYSSWLRYDDASVKPVQEEHVLKPQGTRVPYLLFYRRSDTIRSK